MGHSKTPPGMRGVFVKLAATRLLGNLGHNASTNGAATFADGEAQTLLHSDWSQQLNVEGDSVARHDHLFVGWKLNFTCHVSGAEVKLGLVTLEEWRVTTALF